MPEFDTKKTGFLVRATLGYQLGYRYMDPLVGLDVPILLMLHLRLHWGSLCELNKTSGHRGDIPRQHR